jgi:hypothetical protein
MNPHEVLKYMKFLNTEIGTRSLMDSRCSLFYITLHAANLPWDATGHEVKQWTRPPSKYSHMLGYEEHRGQQGTLSDCHAHQASHDHEGLSPSQPLRVVCTTGGTQSDILICCIVCSSTLCSVVLNICRSLGVSFPLAITICVSEAAACDYENCGSR